MVINFVSELRLEKILEKISETGIDPILYDPPE